MAEKEATVIVVDLSPYMAESHMAAAKGQSDIEMCIKYICDKIGSKVLSERKTDVVGIIGVGTDDTLNRMSEEDAYKHISILFQIRQFLYRDYQLLPKKLVPSLKSHGDLISGLVVAMDAIAEYCKHLKYIKNIVILSNCAGPIDFVGVDGIIDKLEEMKVNLSIFTVGADEDKSTAMQRANHGLLSDLIDRVAGRKLNAVFAPFADVLRDLEIPHVRKVRSTNSYNGTLTIGDPNQFNDSLVIPVERFAYVKKASPISSVAYTKSKGTSPTRPTTTRLGRKVKYEITASKEPEDSKKGKNVREVEKGDLKKGYRYGASVVPLSAEEEDNLRFLTITSLDIIGFVPFDTIGPWQLLTETNFIIAKRNEREATLCLSSLIHAMFENQLYGVARFVSKSDRQPVMILLIPFITEDFEALVETQLPFAEDVRSYKFPSLEIIRTIKGKILKEHHYLPTQEMKNNMKDYINAMDISNLTPEGLVGHLDDTDGREFAAVGEIFNPVLANTRHAIMYRALHPDDELQPPSDSLLRDTYPPEALVTQASPIADRLIESVNVKKIAKYKTNKRRYAAEAEEELKQESILNVDELIGGKASKNEAEEHKSKRRRVDKTGDEENGDFDIEAEIEKWQRIEAGPESDASLPRIFEQACASIDMLLSDENPDLETVIKKVATLRSAAIKLEEPGWYNNYVMKLQDALIMGGPANSVRGKIWEEISLKELGGIPVNNADLED
ncbi:SPOC like C-terminal domain-containing protein [Lipomyces tetrasporus]|uniref:ATP-dependent DNA helicase II subunit 2 n=1 Tax=Lipomyces tetrasporus TaxID=54092 RepID=A0AAD7QP18_9ASCO|nr:SPOC like C-terminal domain-containing protein [Lipomyces tetrasporus]KAJ8098848.1 SPOC like C-terminal domain-containing protein [Lipomyces tetrasporus]